MFKHLKHSTNSSVTMGRNIHWVTQNSSAAVLQSRASEAMRSLVTSVSVVLQLILNDMLFLRYNKHQHQLSQPPDRVRVQIIMNITAPWTEAYSKLVTESWWWMLKRNYQFTTCHETVLRKLVTSYKEANKCFFLKIPSILSDHEQFVNLSNSKTIQILTFNVTASVYRLLMR